MRHRNRRPGHLGRGPEPGEQPLARRTRRGEGHRRGPNRTGRADRTRSARRLGPGDSGHRRHRVPARDAGADQQAAHRLARHEGRRALGHRRVLGRGGLDQAAHGGEIRGRGGARLRGDGLNLAHHANRDRGAAAVLPGPGVGREPVRNQNVRHRLGSTPARRSDADTP